MEKAHEKQNDRLHLANGVTTSVILGKRPRTRIVNCQNAACSYENRTMHAVAERKR